MNDLPDNLTTPSPSDPVTIPIPEAIVPEEPACPPVPASALVESETPLVTPTMFTEPAIVYADSNPTTYVTSEPAAEPLENETGFDAVSPFQADAELTPVCSPSDDAPVLPPETTAVAPPPTRRSRGKSESSDSESVVPDLASEESSALERCERRIGFIFKDKSLLRGALTHASGADHRLASNERLEFLGDAILGSVVCEELFKRYPKYLEGDLTKIKSVVVSRQTCAKVSEAIGLQEFMIVGKGMSSAETVPPSLLADVFESLIAAIYLDGGQDSVRRFIDLYIGPEIDLAAAGELGGNYKSHLQQLAQREFGNTPVYVLVDERGPDHRKNFKVAAQVGQRRFPAAWGRNKKEAEQRAACNALSEVKGEALPFPSD